MNAATISAASATAETQQPRLSECGPSLAEQFARVTPDVLCGMSDTELEDYIQGCAERFLAAQKRWDDTGCFAAIGERDGWWHAEAEALRERGSRPQIVGRMEQERGLA